MAHKLYRFMEIVENSESYKNDSEFNDKFGRYVDELTDSFKGLQISPSSIEDSMLFGLKDWVNKNYPIVYQTEIIPDVRLFEAIGDDEEEEPAAEDTTVEEETVDIDDPNADEKEDLAMIDEPVPADDVAASESSLAPLQPTEPEKGSDINPDEKILDSSQIVQKKEFEENLEQIDKNLMKIKELDANDELNDLFLKELGKKYVIEQELQKLGTGDEFSVENSIDSIFESKNIDNRFHINYNKTVANFKNKFTKLNEAKPLFTKIFSDKIISKLNESLEVVLDESNKQFSIYKVEGLNDKLCLKANFELPVDFSDLLTKEDGFYTFDINDIVPIISDIKQYSYLDASEKYVLELDGAYVSMDDETLDMVDDVDDTDTTFETEKEADDAAGLLYESTMVKFNVRRVVPTSVGSTVISSILDKSKYFKLNENYVVKGEILARKGYPVMLFEKKGSVNKFESLNSSSKNVMLFEENMLFEEMLEPITEIEYNSIKTDTILEDSVLEELRTLCESKGKKLHFKRGVIGRKLYESVYVDDNNVISKEIGDVDEFEKIGNYEEDNDMSYEDSLNLVLDNEEDIVDAVTNQVNSDITLPTVAIENSVDGNISNDITDGQELKITTNVYEDVNGNITNFSDGENNKLVYGKNTVVKYYGEKGVTSDDGESWYNVPQNFLSPFEKFDTDSLVVGGNYTITDLNNSVNAEFVGVHDVEDTLLYEFNDIVGNETYYLKEEDVCNNVK